MDIGGAHFPWSFLVAAALMGIGLLAQVVLEIARHRQYLRYRDTGFVPGTQHWVLATALFQFVLTIGAFVCLVIYAVHRPR